MFRTIIIAVSALIFCFVNAPSADDGNLIANLKSSLGYGLELLHNDKNDDLLLLYVSSGKNSDGEWETDFTMFYLQPHPEGGYSSDKNHNILTVKSYVRQLDWAYDPISKRYLVALLDGEINSTSSEMKLLQLDGKGELVGSVRKLNNNGIFVNYPNVAGIPLKAKNAPADARYMLAGFGQDPKGDWTLGIVKVFLDSNGKEIGKVKFAYTEEEVNGNRKRYIPLKMIISGDKKGYLLACHFSDSHSTDHRPSVVRLNGVGVYEKAVVLDNNKLRNTSLALFPVSKRKVVVSWVDEATLRFWAAVLPANLKSPGATKLISENPESTDNNEFPYTIFCKPDDAKKTSVFFVSDNNSTSVFSTLMKKNGKTKSASEINPWSSLNERMNYIYDRWFCAAPIRGSSDMYCVVASGFGDMELRGFIISGK